MEDLKITGEVEDIIYRNKDNGYTVFSLTTEDDEVTCVGVVPQIHSGEALEIHGSWAMHPLYGRISPATTTKSPVSIANCTPKRRARRMICSART